MRPQWALRKWRQSQKMTEKQWGFEPRARKPIV
jgi:hypothetical protein